MVYVVAEPEITYLELTEGSLGTFPIRISDATMEGMAAGGSVPSRCSVDRNTTDAQNWGLDRRGAPTVGRDSEGYVHVVVSAGIRATPEFFNVDVTCYGDGPMGGAVIGEFQLTARVLEYDYMTLFRTDAPLTLKPDEAFTYSLEVTNNGNRDRVFRGSVEAPDGWTIAYPRSITIPSGETEVVEITGKAPREKLWYSYDSSLMQVTYWPDAAPNKAQTENIPFTVHGFYLHPALIPLILLGILSVFLLAIILVYARRTIEEELLGKPVPPWRIPVEREYLNRLEREDPDEFYIVRYHLMEEEHASALLWFSHFKKATRKDRRAERKWLKKKKKINAKTQKTEIRHEQLKNRTARKLRVVPARRRRKLAALEKKALREQWNEQRRLLKIHKKSIKKIDKLHAKQNKAVEKKHEEAYKKEFKRVEKENKKRLKQGEDSVPLPEEVPFEATEPEFPSVVEVPIVPVQESRFAVTEGRKNDRFKRQIKKRSRKASQRLEKDSTKKNARVSKLRDSLPPEPETQLYVTDEFVPEEEVVVEDARSPVMRMVNMPDLETRDRLERRRKVYKSAIKKAKQAKDEDRIAHLKTEWEKEKRQLLGRKAKKEPSQAREEGPSVGKDVGKTALLSRFKRKRSDDEGGKDAPYQNLKE